ncbi:MAG: hypothetical protein ACLGH3_07695 [Actinomycetota bacterium]
MSDHRPDPGRDRPTDAAATRPADAATTRPTGSKQPIDLPIRQAMPRGLLISFATLALVAIVATGWLLIRPSDFVTVPLQERRPAPADGFSHDPIRVVPVPPPETVPEAEAPCEELSGTRWVMSGDGLTRLYQALKQACTLIGPGMSQDMRQAIEGLGKATVRFAQFERTGIESTANLEDGTLWLNFRFADRALEPIEMLPPLLHEGYHLAGSPEGPDAEAEVAARQVELQACREFIPRDEWKRWCLDALAIVESNDPIALLEGAGFA